MGRFPLVQKSLLGCRPEPKGYWGAQQTNGTTVTGATLVPEVPKPSEEAMSACKFAPDKSLLHPIHDHLMTFAPYDNILVPRQMDKYQMDYCRTCNARMHEIFVNFARGVPKGGQL